MQRSERFNRADKVIKVGFWINAFLMTMKLLAGYFGKSEAVFADGMESACDFVAILGTLIALNVGRKPFDEQHPYGHGKAESISAILVSLLIIDTGGGILFQAVRTIMAGEYQEPQLIAVLAAMVYPDVKVQASDISADALEVARINIDRHGLHGRVVLRQCDGIPKTGSHYDLILCNPPYVNAQSMKTLPPEYLAEPALALDGNRAGGQDGMDFIRQLLSDAALQMTKDAILVLEIGHEREHFEAAFPKLEVVWLETSAGEDQVLLVTHDALAAFHAAAT